jgi:hypothetical protein
LQNAAKEKTGWKRIRPNGTRKQIKYLPARNSAGLCGNNNLFFFICLISGFIVPAGLSLAGSFIFPTFY